ncbi:hypothetical protein [Comamonas aquatica]|uniref:hypothetical protein n=1 Tax=Comamonas aquatica TaxID=225991 RepID=UPI001B38C451|nr:hypothetical protein [Comamonas aquatica]QTX21139.1 hypothetical protein KAQ61_01100 [Comamonas aquatica]
MPCTLSETGPAQTESPRIGGPPGIGGQCDVCVGWGLWGQVVPLAAVVLPGRRAGAVELRRYRVL